MLKKQQYFLAASIFSAPFQRPIYFVKYEADTLTKNKKKYILQAEYSINNEILSFLFFVFSLWLESQNN